MEWALLITCAASSVGKAAEQDPCKRFDNVILSLHFDDSNKADLARINPLTLMMMAA